MTLETIYYITQIIAVGLILISLIAIYVQQRKDHALARAENQREILMQVERLTGMSVSHPEALNNIRDCLHDYEGAPRHAQADFAHFAHKGVSIAESALYMRKAKLINEASYIGMEGACITVLKTPGGLEYWARIRLAVGKDIRDALDEALTERPDVPPVFDLFPQYMPEIVDTITDPGPVEMIAG